MTAKERQDKDENPETTRHVDDQSDEPKDLSPKKLDESTERKVKGGGVHKFSLEID